MRPRALLATMLLAALGGCLQTRSLPPPSPLDEDRASTSTRAPAPPAPPPLDPLPLLNH